MADNLAPRLFQSSTGVSDVERGLTDDVFADASGTAAFPRGRNQLDLFQQADSGFAEALLTSLVRRDQIAFPGATSGLPVPDLPGVSPIILEGLLPQSAKTLPEGVFDVLRDRLRAEMGNWERFSERTVMANAQEFRDSLVSSLLSDAFATTPGLSLGTSDALEVATGVLGLALSVVFRKLGGVGDIAAEAISTLAGIAINHWSETLALADLQQRRRRLESLLIRDNRFTETLLYSIFRIDTVREFYVLWIDRAPNSQLSRFRIPFAPEVHNEAEYSSELTIALYLAGRGRSADVINELSLFHLLKQFGISVRAERDLRLLMVGQPIKAVLSKLLLFPAAAFRPPLGGRVVPGDIIVILLFPEGVDAFRRKPKGVVLLHESTAHSVLFRFSDRLFHNVPI